MTESLFDPFEQPYIDLLPQTLKDSIWRLMMKGQSRAHIRMTIRGKTIPYSDLRRACELYIEVCSEQIERQAEQP